MSASGETPLHDPLTDREQEILARIADGLSNQEIANQLHLAEKTVRWYNSQIYSKLGADNREHAVDLARVAGLLPDAPIVEGKHNLPAQATPFVGRRHELDDLAMLLDDSDIRLITILAPGGMGKTRLAPEAARHQIGRYTDGVFFVPLAPLSNPNDIVTTIAEVIGFVFYGDSPPPQQVVDFLRGRAMLLVLDNFEHLLDGASLVADLVQAAPGVKVLATSRERLNLRGETVYSLRGLDFPTWETPEDALEYDAVRLFMQSAHLARPDFELQTDDLNYLARICRLTEGMPLGIELAAGWVDVLSLEQIAAEIQQGIDILETDLRDVPERQRSVRATFEQTWNRLSEEEQTIFKRLPVFRGGFTLEAAQVVAGANARHLRALSQKALIQIESSERFAIHELLRQYAEEKLVETPDARQQTQRRHTTYYLDFLHEAEAKLKGPEQIAVLDEVEVDIDNIRTAWQQASALKQEQQLNKAIEGLALFYIMQSRSTEGEQVFERTRQQLESVETPLLAKLLLFQARFVATQDWERGIELARHGLSLWHRLVSPGEAGFARGLAQILLNVQSYSDKDSYSDESNQLEKHLAAFRHKGDRWGEAWMLYCLGGLSLGSKKNDEAFQFFQRSVSIFRALGNPWAVTFPLGYLADLLVESRHYEEAKEVVYEVQATSRIMGDLQGIIYTSWQLAKIAHIQGEDQNVTLQVREGLQLALEIQSYPLWLLIYSPLIVHLLTTAGATEQAVELAVFAKHKFGLLTDTAQFASLHQRVGEQLQFLETQLNPDVFSAATHRGKVIQSEAFVKNLLAELAET